MKNWQAVWLVLKTAAPLAGGSILLTVEWELLAIFAFEFYDRKLVPLSVACLQIPGVHELVIFLHLFQKVEWVAEFFIRPVESWDLFA